MQRNLEFPSYYLTGRSSPVNPQRHLCVNPIISVLPQPHGCARRTAKTISQSTSLWHTVTTAAPAMCCMWVGQLNKEIHCKHSIWQPTVHPHTEHRNVFTAGTTTNGQKSHKQASKGQKFPLWSLCLSVCYCSQSSGCLPFTSLTPKALSWNMHSHSIYREPESTHRTEGLASFLCQSQKKSKKKKKRLRFVGHLGHKWASFLKTESFCFHRRSNK